MQFVDLALAAGVAEGPHPLLAERGDLQRIGRRAVALHEQHRAPAEEDEGDRQARSGPADFQRQAASASAGAIRARSGAVLDGVANNERG